MARGNFSKNEYLRPEIIEAFLAGKTGGELAEKYKQIPKATIYRWIKDVRDITGIDSKAGTNTRQPESDKATNPSHSQAKASLNIVTLPMSNTVEDTLPDFQYLKRKLRKIINTDGDDLSRNDGIRVNAINAYMKVVLAEIGNKQIALGDEDDLEEEQVDYSKLSEEELTELYQRKLKNLQ